MDFLGYKGKNETVSSSLQFMVVETTVFLSWQIYESLAC